MLTNAHPVQLDDGILSCQTSLLAPRRLVAAWAWANQGRLDAALAAGADPTSSAALAARAAQLATPRSRWAMAAAIERLAIGAGGRERRYAVTPLPSAVAPNREALLALASRLRDGAPAYVRGLAGARLIVTDGTGPAYTDRRGEALALEIELVSAGLRG